MARQILNLDHTLIEVGDIIENGPLRSRRCTVNGTRRMTMRQLSRQNPNINILLHLNYHENILNLYIPCAYYENENFVVFEDYHRTVSYLFVPKNFKDFSRQICSGLDHYHKSGITFSAINISNFIRSAARDSENRFIHRYKLTCICLPIFYNDKDNLKLRSKNIRDLGENLFLLYGNIRDNDEDSISVHDSICALDFIRQMRDYDTMDLKHPFLWSVHESLMFIVKIVKKFEELKHPKRFNTIDFLLEESETEIIGKSRNWHGKAKTLVERVTAINKKASNGKGECKPHSGLRGLLQTIRNLVSH